MFDRAPGFVAVAEFVDLSERVGDLQGLGVDPGVVIGLGEVFNDDLPVPIRVAVRRTDSHERCEIRARIPGFERRNALEQRWRFGVEVDEHPAAPNV